MRSSSIVFAISLIVLVPFEAYADFATQTDWSGGDGILGPVFDWGNEFYQSLWIDWSGYPGIMLLSPGILEHTVDGAFDGVYSVYSIQWKHNSGISGKFAPECVET